MESPLQKTKKPTGAIASEIIAEPATKHPGGNLRDCSQDEIVPLPSPEAAIEEDVVAREPRHPVVRSPPIFPTAFYQTNGIRSCADCGEKFRTGMHGEAICAIASSNCVRLKNG